MSEREVVVMLPDFKGEWVMLVECEPVLSRRFEDFHVVPVLNGSPADDLERVAEIAQGLGFEPLVTDAQGLVASLIDGYAHVMEQYPGIDVVRMDTKEHPPIFIPELLAAARRVEGMAVGDLDFSSGHLTPDSPDEFVHLWTLPELTRQFSGGAFELSCAHGYQAFFGPALPPIFAGGHRIVLEAEREMRELDLDKPTIRWGFDVSMPLSAAFAGLDVEVVKVPATEPRNRSNQKIADQVSNITRLGRAAERVFGQSVG